jgi:hypothetical protein
MMAKLRNHLQQGFREFVFHLLSSIYKGIKVAEGRLTPLLRASEQSSKTLFVAIEQDIDINSDAKGVCIVTPSKLYSTYLQ